MNEYIISAIILVALILIWRIIAMKSGVRISASEVKTKMELDKGIVLLDVRSREEYIKKHIPKSILIPVNQLEDEANKRLPDKNTEIIVYCASGTRSAMAAKILSKLGYSKVYNLGGIYKWPYETTAGSN